MPRIYDSIPAGTNRTQAVRTESTNETIAYVTDHGSLSGLSDDDHTQYLLANGNREMTGNLVIHQNSIFVWPLITLRREDGDTAVDSGDNLGGINFSGSVNNIDEFNGGVLFLAEATENWDATNNGSRLIISVVGDGSNSAAEALRILGIASGVNNLQIQPAATGNGPTLSTIGSDTNADLNITPKGTGRVNLDGVKWPAADGTNAQHLTTNGAGSAAWSDTTLSGVIEIPYPATSMEFVVKYFPEAITLTEVYSITDTASTTMDFDLIERARSTPFSGGTAVTSADIQATSTGTTTTTFSNSSFDADDCMVIDVTAVSATAPSLVRVFWKGTLA